MLTLIELLAHLAYSSCLYVPMCAIVSAKTFVKACFLERYPKLYFMTHLGSPENVACYFTI